MIVVLRNEAAVELENAFDHYAHINVTLATEMLAEFRFGLDQILEHPHGWQLLD